MNRLAKLQLIGPIFLFAAVLAAEVAAWALSMFPSSEALWYVNLGLFGLFQRNRDVDAIARANMLRHALGNLLFYGMEH